MSQESPTRDQLLAAIRAHRDARGHNRCWLDDETLYRAAGLTPTCPELPPREEFLACCAAYYDAQVLFTAPHRGLADELEEAFVEFRRRDGSPWPWSGDLAQIVERAVAALRGQEP